MCILPNEFLVRLNIILTYLCFCDKNREKRIEWFEEKNKHFCFLNKHLFITCLVYSKIRIMQNSLYPGK